MRLNNNYNAHKLLFSVFFDNLKKKKYLVKRTNVRIWNAQNHLPISALNE